MKNEWFVIKKINKHIFAITEPYHFQKVISYLVIGRKKALLFDTGMGYEDIKKITKTLTSRDVVVFLTHAHWDHIGGAVSFADIYINPHHFETNAIKHGFDSNKIIELQERKYFVKPFITRNYKVKGVISFKNLSDLQPVVIDMFTIIPIFTPGHTPGSTCFIIKELNCLITGDTVYPGPLYAQLPESNFQEYQKSLNRIVKLVNSKIRILPGHNKTLLSYTSLLMINKAFEKIEVKKQIPDIITPEGLEYCFSKFSIILKINNRGGLKP